MNNTQRLKSSHEGFKSPRPVPKNKLSLLVWAKPTSVNAIKNGKRVLSNHGPVILRGDYN